MASDSLSAMDAANSAARVDTNVYISGYLIAADPDFIRRNGINRIVKLIADDSSYHGGYHRHPDVKYLVIAADDTPSYDIRAGADSALRFIQEGIANNERILVHCHAGISRSATVVLLHLMINRGYTLEFAFMRLRMARPFVNPNPGFMRHLLATDARIKSLRVADEHLDNERNNSNDRFVAPPPVLAGGDAAAARRAATALRVGAANTASQLKK